MQKEMAVLTNLPQQGPRASAATEKVLGHGFHEGAWARALGKPSVVMGDSKTDAHEFHGDGPSALFRALSPGYSLGFGETLATLLVAFVQRRNGDPTLAFAAILPLASVGAVDTLALACSFAGIDAYTFDGLSLVRRNGKLFAFVAAATGGDEQGGDGASQEGTFGSNHGGVLSKGATPGLHKGFGRCSKFEDVATGQVRRIGDVAHVAHVAMAGSTMGLEGGSA